MTAPVLVAYATQYGSTREVAEAVAAELREGGLAVEVRPTREVRTVEGYRTVVLGAPFYIGRWHGDAQRFLSQHREALTQRTVAVFALGPIGTDEQEMLESRKQLDGELERNPWLTPITVKMFGGKYDPSKLSFCHRLLGTLPASPLHGLPESDVRDWEAIRAWARDLARRLGSALSL